MTLLHMLCGLWPCMATARLPPVRAVGQATVFHAHGDRDNPNLALGCVRAARRLGLRDMADHLPVVAMRESSDSAACGALVYVHAGARGTWAIRLTSGPYGQACPEGRRVGAVLGDGCRWLGVIDLSPAVAVAIGLPGRGVNRKGAVSVRYWP